MNREHVDRLLSLAFLYDDPSAYRAGVNAAISLMEHDHSPAPQPSPTQPEPLPRRNVS